MTRRSSGILAHISSLPSDYGIGDIGLSGQRFIDFLVTCGQSYWQFLPTGPTHRPFDYSPYMSSSAFAGSYLLLSPELLLKAGLISNSNLQSHSEFSSYVTDYPEVEVFKKYLLKEAFKSFRPENSPEYEEFIQNTRWLNDYALFMTAKEVFNDAGWFSWPREIATRSDAALKLFKQQHIERIDYYRFEQFEFSRQWKLLHRYAKQQGISLFGDLPIYVSYDSVDVWANQQLFTLDRNTLSPTHVAGVPPDYFSDSGQRWGNPLYDWQSEDQEVEDQLVRWWTDRLANLFAMVDMARIDHFRGFESYWSIPQECETAIDGKWLKGPGKVFFDKIAATLGPLNIVAEDLGIITSAVEELRDELGFPGMKVLQFAFDGNPDNSFLPHNFTSPQCIVYTGTHDNDTSLGWFMSDRLNDQQRATIKHIANRNSQDNKAIHHLLIYLAQSSVSMLSIIPLQDVFGFGNDCRMNRPGVATGNWHWRCGPEFLNIDAAQHFKVSTELFNRGRTKY